jgi:ParB family transcriptional regulator, chromosome partitioning protein
VLNKKGLGRGLDALIPQPSSTSDSDLVASIDVRDLRPNPYQPRQTFNEEKLEELAQSIREHGIIQPLIVRKSAVKGYDIVAGERRFRAAQIAGLSLVPAVVREFTDVDLMEIAMIENLQRENLNPIETAEAYAKLIERCGMTQEQLAQRVGQSRSHIANMLRLLHLPDEVRGIVSRGTLSMGHARALLAIDDKGKLIELAKRTVLEDWSVRKLESVIYEKPKSKNVSRETNTQQDKYFFKQYEDRFRNFLGTAVRIQPGKKRGKIEIDYFSKDDLDRILNLLVTKTKQDGA